MEIVLLIVIWIIAAISSGSAESSFSLFLVFTSLVVIVWRWRAKLASLREQMEQETRSASSLLSDLQLEVKRLSQELRLLKSQLTASPEQHPAATSQEHAISAPKP